MNVDLSAAQQELLKIRNQFGSSQLNDRQIQKNQQDKINFYEQIKQKQNLESELKLCKESRFTKTIDTLEMNASQYQRKIKEIEEDIKILIDDYNKQGISKITKCFE